MISLGYCHIVSSGDRYIELSWDLYMVSPGACFRALLIVTYGDGNMELSDSLYMMLTGDWTMVLLHLMM